MCINSLSSLFLCFKTIYNYTFLYLLPLSFRSCWHPSFPSTLTYYLWSDSYAHTFSSETCYISFVLSLVTSILPSLVITSFMPETWVSFYHLKIIFFLICITWNLPPPFFCLIQSFFKKYNWVTEIRFLCVTSRYNYFGKNLNYFLCQGRTLILMVAFHFMSYFISSDYLATVALFFSSSLLSIGFCARNCFILLFSDFVNKYSSPLLFILFLLVLQLETPGPVFPKFPFHQSSEVIYILIKRICSRFGIQKRSKNQWFFLWNQWVNEKASANM